MGENLQALAEWLSLYGYPVLFLAVCAENAGLPVPGETAVLVAGLLASRPGSPLSIVWVIVVAVIAAVLGDNLGFLLGRRWARGRLRQGKRFLVLTPGGLQAVEGYFEHYGALTIFCARFVPGLRVVAGLAAGTSRMAWPRFLLANAGGAVAWAVTMALLGYFFGHSWQALHKWLGRGGLLILGCVILLVGLPYLWRRARRLPAGSWDRLLRSQVWQGLLAALLVVVCMAVLVVLAERHAAPSGEDQEVRRWVAARHVPWLDAVATGGSYLGSLPVVAFLVTLLGIRLWYGDHPRREVIAVLWALAASEGVGLLLLGLLRHGGVEPARALAWPFGFAGLAPLRGAAVYGMAAQVLGRQVPAWGRWAGALAVLLVLLIGFSVVWSQEQSLTEVLVEYVAGAWCCSSACGGSKVWVGPPAGCGPNRAASAARPGRPSPGPHRRRGRRDRHSGEAARATPDTGCSGLPPPPRRGCGVAGQEPVPGQHEPRAAHPLSTPSSATANSCRMRPRTWARRPPCPTCRRFTPAASTCWR